MAQHCKISHPQLCLGVADIVDTPLERALLKQGVSCFADTLYEVCLHIITCVHCIYMRVYVCVFENVVVCIWCIP